MSTRENTRLIARAPLISVHNFAAVQFTGRFISQGKALLLECVRRLGVIIVNNNPSILAKAYIN